MLSKRDLMQETMCYNIPFIYLSPLPTLKLCSVQKWQPTRVFSPRKSHEQRSLTGIVRGVPKESDTLEQLYSNISDRERMLKNQS